MLLAIDAGNTSITTGIFDRDVLVKKAWFDSDKNGSAEHYTNLFEKEFSKDAISGCIISSVVKELTPVLQQSVKSVFNINAVVLDASLKTELKIDVKNPHSVGADRIANSYAALKKYQLPVIVIDMGTATTFDIVDKNGAFSGGIIMPGIGLQLKVLGSNTSLLPELNAEKVDKAIGTDTKTCILSGVIKGHAHAIEGLLRDCEKELGTRPTIIGTGGYIKLVNSCLEESLFDNIEPDLTLNGLRMIYENCI